MHKNKIAVQEKIFDPKLELSLQAGIETGKELLKTSRRIEKKLHIQNELATLLIQKPNKRILNLVRFNLWVYNKANKGLEKRFKWWLKNKVGEPPVILNKNDIIKTARLMKDYLYNKGFFYADVNYFIKIKNKKAEVKYTIATNELYTIDSVEFPSRENLVVSFINSRKRNTLLKQGDAFDVDVLSKERERISDDLRNLGYFEFKKEFVYFEIDSFKRNRKLKVFPNVTLDVDGKEHKIYAVERIYIYPDYDSEAFIEGKMDTFMATRYKKKQRGEDTSSYYIIAERLNYNTQVILGNVFFQSGRIYSQNDYDLTINRLSELGMFKFVNIKFKELKSDSIGRLECHIYLISSKRQEMSIETEANTNTDYFLGTALKYTYKSKNLFHNADLLIFNMKGGVEFQDSGALFNTIDISARLDFYLPKFLLPVDISRVAHINDPKTAFSLSYSFLKRLNLYAIKSTNLTLGYEWNTTKLKRHLLNPVAINLVSLNEAETSEEFLTDLAKKPLLFKSFQEQLIIGPTYTYIYSNQPIAGGRNFLFFKGDIDLSGNLVQLGNNIFKKNLVGGNVNNLFGIRYSQYTKLDIDTRYYFIFSNWGTVVTRLSGGVGFPYSNSEVLPYIKQYFTGGSSGIRAWRVRELGPGAFNPGADPDTNGEGTSIIDQTGDMKMEANIEYRFDVIGLLKGAMFVDAGNIWNIKLDTTRPEGLFELDDFHQEIAIGAGVGARFDFTFFVLRIDVAFPLRNPARNEGDRWLGGKIAPWDKDWRQNNLLLNFAIGYPF